MGTLGWAQCEWCWKWQYNMYIGDAVGAPLCDSCQDCDEPPWYPNNRQRSEHYFKAILRSHGILNLVAVELASFLANPYAV